MRRKTYYIRNKTGKSTNEFIVTAMIVLGGSVEEESESNNSLRMTMMMTVMEVDNHHWVDLSIVFWMPG